MAQAIPAYEIRSALDVATRGHAESRTLHDARYLKASSATIL
jgi:hypothetical protein